MNTYSDPGPFGADTDDAICALIDGELAGFASDHGLDLASVEATLANWRGLDQRRAWLTKSQAALRAPVPLDEESCAAMVATALDPAAAPAPEAPVVELAPRRRRPATVLLRAAAAVVILAAGVGGILALRQLAASEQPTASRPPAKTVEPNQEANPSGTGQLPSGAVPPEGATPPPAGAVGGPTTPRSPQGAASLGDVADPDVLRALVAERIGTAGPPGGSVCPNLDLFPPGASVVLRVPATFNGRPAEVDAAAQGGQTVVFVVDASACTVLSAITL